MKRVHYKKIPLWKIISRIITPRLRAPGFPVRADDGDPFFLSESENGIEYIDDATWRDVINNIIPYLHYAWKSGQLKTTIKFMTVGTIGLILNIIIVKFTIAIGIDAKIAGVIGTVLTIFTNFLINDVWTFSEHRSKRPWLHRLAGYYAASLGTMIIQIIIYEVMVVSGVPPVISVIASVAISYVLRLVYIRDKVYQYR